VGAAEDPHVSTPRPAISGAADSVTGTPLAPLAPTGKYRPDKAGAVTPKAMKTDTHSEAKGTAKAQPRTR
jgi:hypothetical protein